jgi:SAM-dependent methyltransferase
MVSTFQTDSILRLLQVNGSTSAVYVAGPDPQSAHAVTALEGEGLTVAVTDSAKLSAGLPEECKLLMIDHSGGQCDLLSQALQNGAKPDLIVLNDAEEDAGTRRRKYELLTDRQYFFAGVQGRHSLWTRAKRPPERVAETLASLPNGIRALPLGGSGTAMLDREMAPAGEVLQVPVRAALDISGWAVISAELPPAEHVFACVRHEQSGLEEFLRMPKEPRPDVSAHFRNGDLLMTGFRVSLAPLCRRWGVHSVSVVQSDGKHRYESEPLFRFAMISQEFELAARKGLANRYLFGSGIEIGALQKPLQVSKDCQVRYIDRMTLDKLLEHYPEMAQYPLQAPDVVDDGQQLTHIAEDSQDFIIANHFLEHCPDPIRSIQTMLRVLKPGGILFLAVPDKRHTFDMRRPSTAYAALKNAYVSGQRSGIAELFYEWALLVTGLPPEEAKQRAEELMAEDYSIHYNVWAATDLLSFLLAARQDFQIPFELAAAVSSENETIVLLERTSGRAAI